MAKQETESAKVTDIDSLTVSAAVLGNIFGVTDRRIRQMAEEGIIVRAAKGRYNLVDSLKNYILSLKLAVDSNDSDNPDGELNFEEEKAMKGELHKADDVRHVMTDMLSSFKTRMMNIPAKVAPVLEDRDAGYIKERLTSEVTEALNELKDYNPADFYSDEYVEGEDDEQI